MAHIVTARCVDCRYTDCCAVCPVDCFYEIESPAMLVIDPDTCIDCGLCIPECPVHAIYPEAELPEAYAEWTDLNREYFEAGEKISKKVDALPGALPLSEIQANEQAAGLDVAEPSAADDEEVEGVEADEAVAEAGEVSEESLMAAMADSKYQWRSVAGLAMELGSTASDVESGVESLISQGKVRKYPSDKGVSVYGAIDKVGAQ
jgi:ferredoxin